MGATLELLSGAGHLPPSLAPRCNFRKGAHSKIGKQPGYCRSQNQGIHHRQVHMDAQSSSKFGPSWTSSIRKHLPTTWCVTGHHCLWTWSSESRQSRQGKKECIQSLLLRLRLPYTASRGCNTDACCLAYIHLRMRLIAHLGRDRHLHV